MLYSFEQAVKLGYLLIDEYLACIICSCLQLPLGVSMAASVRVGTALGSGDYVAARTTSLVATLLASTTYPETCTHMFLVSVGHQMCSHRTGYAMLDLTMRITYPYLQFHCSMTSACLHLHSYCWLLQTTLYVINIQSLA